MAKFKVGDKVKVIDNPTLLLSQKKQIGKVLEVVEIYNDVAYYLSDCADKNHCPLYFDKELELVEPKEDKPSKVVYDYRGHDNILNLLIGMSGAIIIVDQKDYCDSELRNHARARNIDLVMYVDRRKETLNQDPFNLNPHEFDNKAFDFRRYSVERNKDLVRGLRIGTTIIVTPEQFDLIGKKFSDTDISFEQECRQRGLKVEVRPHLTPKLESVKIDTIKKAFERPMIFGGAIQGLFDIDPELRVYFESIRKPSVPTQPQPPKNRIPDRVVFNQDKGKVTVLISKHLDGVAPYWAYTVKTSENDKYDAIFGFMLAYFKYLNRSLEPKEQKAVIERVFKMSQTKRFPYLMGVVEQELLKLLGTTIKVEEIILAITSPNADMNYINVTWDYAEWKEMLRVHELETKREEQKAIRKEIKKHEQEIEKLKKKGV